MSEDLEEIKVSIPEPTNRKIRVGTFSVKDNLIEDDLLAEAFAQMKFVPVRCELKYGGMFEMIGISHMFDEIEFGSAATPYHINIAVNNETGEFDHVDVSYA